MRFWLDVLADVSAVMFKLDSSDNNSTLLSLLLSPLLAQPGLVPWVLCLLRQVFAHGVVHLVFL